MRIPLISNSDFNYLYSRIQKIFKTQKEVRTLEIGVL